VLHILGDCDSDVIPTASQTKEMEYLNMVIKEVRLSLFYIDNL
jgi:hypothetical protein